MFLKVLAVFLVIFIVAGLTMMVIRARKYTRAINYQFKNSIYCGKPICNPEIEDYDPLSSIPTSYSKQMALYCANLVLIVELNGISKSLIPDPKGLTKVAVMFDDMKNPPIGMVWKGVITLSGETKTVAYVIFRGTESPQEWIQDFDYKESNYSQVNITSKLKSVSNVLIRTGTENIMVHSGFANAYSNVRNGLIKTLTTIKPDYVVVSGHSLGSALSLLASVDIASSQIVSDNKNIILYNYASPRVGNPAFCNLVKSLGFPFYRLANTEDIVPTVPASVSPNFDDPEHPFIFQHCGTAVYMTIGRNSVLNNHLLGAYVQGINGL